MALAKTDLVTDFPQHNTERRVISGFSNPTVKFLRSLREKKHRKASGKFLAEGLRLLTDARESGYIPETLVLSNRRDPHTLLESLEKQVLETGGDVIETSPDILAKITGKSNPQAVAGVFAEFETGLNALHRDAAPIWIVAQDLRDPGNLGTCSGALGRFYSMAKGRSGSIGRRILARSGALSRRALCCTVLHPCGQ